MIDIVAFFALLMLLWLILIRCYSVVGGFESEWFPNRHCIKQFVDKINKLNLKQSRSRKTV